MSTPSAREALIEQLPEGFQPLCLRLPELTTPTLGLIVAESRAAAITSVSVRFPVGYLQPPRLIGAVLAASRPMSEEERNDVSALRLGRQALLESRVKMGALTVTHLITSRSRESVPPRLRGEVEQNMRRL